MGDRDSLAEFIYLDAGYSLEHPPGPGWLAKSLIGGDVLAYAPADQVIVARPVVVHGRFRILVNRNATPEKMSIGIAREVARWWLSHQQTEVAVGALEALAEALLIPAPAVRWARARSMAVEEIAQAFVCEQDIVQRRLDMVRQYRRSSGVFSLRDAG
jgi:hypothetical protein